MQHTLGYLDTYLDIGGSTTYHHSVNGPSSLGPDLFTN